MAPSGSHHRPDHPLVLSRMLTLVGMLALCMFFTAHAFADSTPIPPEPTRKPAIPAPVSKPASHAESKEDKKNEYLLSASEMDNDEQSGVVTASGAVEIHNDAQILQADQVKFNQKINVMYATGNVAMVGEDSNYVFANEAVMSNDFVNGSLKKPAMLMTDNSRFIAHDGRRLDNRYMLFTKGVFSPCDLCSSNPRKSPLWQVKASKVTHDTVAKDIIYRDATLEMWGIPLLYTPYLSQPDPTVKRRQGLLSMHYTHSGDLGNAFVIPYYFDIAPDMDYTAKPNFNSSDGVRWEGTLRKRYQHGDIRVDHSFVVTDRLDEDNVIKKDQLRGHLAGYAHFDIDNIYRTGADFAVQTDKNYLLRYNQSAEDVATNRVFIEGFKGRGFGTVEMLYFQDNRPGARPEQPLVLPRFRISQMGEPNMTLGGRWSFNGDASYLRRDTGQQEKKIGVDFGWQRRDILPFGFVSTLTSSVRNDTYLVNNLTSPDTPGVVYNDDIANRLFPQGQMMFSYPLAAYTDSFTHTIEPIFAITASPTRKLDPRIPNEDSQDVDFDTSNLFELNRYPGNDAMEQGVRAAYGFKTGFYNHSGGSTELTFGQSYRLSDDPLFPKGTGLDTPLSDYVAQFKFDPGPWMTLDYNMRIDRDLKAFRRNEIYTSFGIPEFRPHVTYTYSDPAIFVPGISNRVEEFKPGFTTSFMKYYSIGFDQTYTLRPDTQGLLTTSASITYNDECFTSFLSFSRDHTVRTGVSSGDTFFFRILFKHLGGIDG